MKKNLKTILALTLAVVFIIPFALVLSACGATTQVVSTYDALVSALSGTSNVVKLDADIDVEDMLLVKREMTLDLNGHKLYNTKDIWFDKEEPQKWSIIEVGKDGVLTITGNGKIDAKENDCYAIDVADGGKLTIEDGEFIGNISAVYVYEGSAEIKGGKFSIKQLNDNKVESPYGLTINIYNNDPDKDGVRLLEEKGTVSITGGLFKNFDPAGRVDNPHDELVAKGYKAKETPIDGEKYYEIVKE